MRLALIIRFELEVQATYYYNQYLVLKQESAQTIDDYANQFLELRRKVDSNNNTLVVHMVLKFV